VKLRCRTAIFVAATISCGLAANPAWAEFRHQGPPADNGDEIYTFAWGTSVGGTYVAGEASVDDCTINTIGQGGLSCTMAAVWAPNFGAGATMDEPFILPLLTAGLPDLRNNYRSQARAIDADGDTIVGRDEYSEAIENPPGHLDEFSYHRRYRALVWTRNLDAPWSDTNAQVTELEPYAGYDYAGARGVSDDGNFAVGWNTDDNLDGFINTQAALWVRTGANAWDPARMLGYLTDGDDDSVANGVAVGDDGKPVVVGWSGYAGSEDHVLEGSDNEQNVFDASLHPQAFVWTQATGMRELKNLPQDALHARDSDATAISADAKTIVGWSERPSRSDGEPYLEAVRWTRSGNDWSVAQGLGVFDLPASLAAKVQEDFSDDIEEREIIPLGSVALGVSEHGKAAVGYQAFGYDTERGGQSQFRLAYFWSEDHGKTGRYLGDVLKDEGVDIGPWVLFTATGVREKDDFFIIVGDGSNNGELQDAPLPGYIARLGRDPDSPSGFTTPTEQMISFTELSTAAMAIGTNVGNTLTGLNDMAENHRCIRPQDNLPTGWCFFTFGTAMLFNGDGKTEGDQFSGDVGLAHYFTPVTSAGASIGGGVIDTDLHWDGGYRANDLHVGGYLAHIPDTGLRLFGAGVWGDMSDVELTRGYLNGLAMTYSRGDTDGEGWGLLGRVGYGFRAGNHLLTPFAEVSYTDASLDGYSETGGPFPTTFQGVETNTTTGRLGILEETDLSPTIRVFGSAAWAHVLDSETPLVTGAVLDIFELSAHGGGGLTDWAEFMSGGRYQLSQQGVLSVIGRVSTEFDEFFALQGRVAYSHTF
jgi:uncharacterized membrane protein